VPQLRVIFYSYGDKGGRLCAAWFALHGVTVQLMPGDLYARRYASRLIKSIHIRTQSGGIKRLGTRHS